MDIGCVRMTERHLRGDPPPRTQVAAAEPTCATRSSLTAGTYRSAGPDFVGVCRHGHHVAALALGLARYDPDPIHGSRIPAAAVRETSDWLLRSTRAQRAANPSCTPAGSTSSAPAR